MEKPNENSTQAQQQQQTQLLLNGGIALTAFFAFTALFGKDQIVGGLLSALYIGLSVAFAYWGLKFTYDIYLTLVQRNDGKSTGVSDALLDFLVSKKAGVSENVSNMSKEDKEAFLQWKIQQEEQAKANVG